VRRGTARTGTLCLPSLPFSLYSSVSPRACPESYLPSGALQGCGAPGSPGVTSCPGPGTNQSPCGIAGQVLRRTHVASFGGLGEEWEGIMEGKGKGGNPCGCHRAEKADLDDNHFSFSPPAIF
jgi:hypothetical protein